ncbi:MAG: zinc/iron-chelating domain-containing protein [Archangium gephyra]|uniref:Zinc/iron-chelating domain-containing protein n=1 Tax=Archangium gephyra TaxID=48 RepID=A0A2W5USB0_9BACT|nr:MAG: zinc/iron-chelating domain-containing protein [Archangium gephyra]
MKLAEETPGSGDLRIAWRRAVTETKAVLQKADAAWSRHGCPASGECCQLSVTKRQPFLWPSEWKLLEEQLKRSRRPMPAPRPDGACPFLDAQGKRCTVYESRPFGCRTFFCHRITGPAKVPSEDTNTLLDRLAALNLAVDAEAAPRAMLEWCADAEP